MKQPKRIFPKNKLASEYYRLAFQCEKNRQQYGCNACDICQFNVALYVDDIREITLLKTTAAIDVHKHNEYKSQQNVAEITKLVLLLGIIVFFAIKCGVPSNQTKNVSSVKENSVPQSSQQSSRDIYEAVRSFCPPVLPTNTNNDGKLNCIDFAVALYHKLTSIYIPDAIYYVYTENPRFLTGSSTSKAHLLIMVRSSKYNRDIYIEPTKGVINDYIVHKSDTIYPNTQKLRWYVPGCDTIRGEYNR